jgi:transcriptional regulator
MESTLDVPWKMADAPPAFIAEQLGNIVGIEIPVNRMIGKWKTSQNRPVEDRLGAIDGLRNTNTPEGVAMAMLMERTVAGE